MILASRVFWLMKVTNKMCQSTSNSMMTQLLRLAIAAIVLGLPGVSSSFACPLMTTSAAQQEPCPDCPVEEEESCPRSECLLICPYADEKTAVWTGGNLTSSVIPQVERSSALIVRSLPDPHLVQTSTPREVASAPLYLVNRVLLI